MSASLPSAELWTQHALFRCLVREWGGQIGPDYATVRCGGSRLRACTSGGIVMRCEGPVEVFDGGDWRPIATDRLIALIAGGPAAGGTRRQVRSAVDTEAAVDEGGEFVGQVRDSWDVAAAIVEQRAGTVAPDDPWLASEQALVAGHPFHPSPKGRGRGWQRYAPETHSTFALRYLAIPQELLDGVGEFPSVDVPHAPAGYFALPVHPWQAALLATELRATPFVDLGEFGAAVSPTSSVRTVYDPEQDLCWKFSLDVRITNCVRKNSWYELRGAVELSRRLAPVFAEIVRDHPGTRWLAEPGYRTVTMDVAGEGADGGQVAGRGRRLHEGLGVIVRQSPWQVASPGIIPRLAGSIAVDPPKIVDPLAWWQAYVRTVALPALALFHRHGVVLEAHLQNVLVGLDDAYMPVEAIFRDLEGVKLVDGRHDLAGLPRRVAEGLSYSPTQGRRRLWYCLVVNHLAEIAATAADGDPALLRRLWRDAADQLGPIDTDLVTSPTLPAKGNLTVRLAHEPDRAAPYVEVPNPLVAP